MNITHVLASGLALAWLALAPAIAKPAAGNAATVKGLVGKVTYADQQSNKSLDAALANDPQSFADIQTAFEDALKVNLSGSRDLHTAFALAASGPAGGPGPYNVAARAHEALNKRLRGLLDRFKSSIAADQLKGYRDTLDQAQRALSDRSGAVKQRG